MTRINFGEWQASARSALTSVSENPGLEAQLLLAHATGRPKTWVLAHPEEFIPDSQLVVLTHLLAQLAAGIPLPYLTGQQEFYGLPFYVSPAVLIPRPETELLVERALDWIHTYSKPIRAADIGTGSGCIAISLARGESSLQVDAVDCSFAALRIASKNIQRHQVTEQVHLIQGDLLTALGGPYSLICANLPYIPSATLSSLPVARYEPLAALDGGDDGLAQIQRMLCQVRRVILPSACILLEIEHRQAASASVLARKNFPKSTILVHQDLASLDRLIEIQV